jgi:hypothetical protein
MGLPPDLRPRAARVGVATSLPTSRGAGAHSVSLLLVVAPSLTMNTTVACAGR